MINLLQSNIDVIKARDEHYKFFRCFVTKRLTDHTPIDCHFITNFPKRNMAGRSNYFNLLNCFVICGNNLERILIGTPKELIEVNNDFVKLVEGIYGKGSYNKCLNWTDDYKKKISNPSELDLIKFMKDIRLVFNYDWFNKLEPIENYSAYHLAENLDVRSCTFCNRTYTITRTSSTKGKLMRPQLDHWFPKSKFPLMAISFYNLIPCCSYCNSSVKGVIELNLDEYIHPYVKEDMEDDCSFDYYHSEKIDLYKIFIKKPFDSSGKAHRTLKKLKIDQMYDGHHSELEDLIKIRKAYSSTYIDKLAEFFPNTGLPSNEVYRLLFGTEIDEKDFHKRPLSKFKHDILTELGILPMK